jgi:hypothetical protein
MGYLAVILDRGKRFVARLETPWSARHDALTVVLFSRASTIVSRAGENVRTPAADFQTGPFTMWFFAFQVLPFRGISSEIPWYGRCN